MLSIVLFYSLLFNSLLLFGAERPKYRFDYQYEKAFDTFYKLHPTAATWAEARIRCQAEGSELLVVDSLDEADAVVLLVTLIQNQFEGIFVGIHDLYSERTFVTIRGDTLINSIQNLLWEYKEPMYRRGRCVAMRRTGRLFVHPCDKSLPFICKIKAKDIQFRSECDTFNSEWKLGPNNTCYFLHMEPQTWSQAYASCYSAGGLLAILNSQAEADHLKMLYKQQHEKRRMPCDNLIFLGYNDIFQRYHYRTILGERIEDIGYKEWEMRSCSNTKKSNESDMTSETRCGGMRPTGLLAVAVCGSPHMFFCEKPANSTVAKNIMRLGTIRHKTQLPRAAYESYHLK